MPNEIIAIACFVCGIVIGAVLMILGVKYGFKASYQIREVIGGEEMPDSLLNSRTDPAEFDLLEKESE